MQLLEVEFPPGMRKFVLRRPVSEDELSKAGSPAIVRGSYEKRIYQFPVDGSPGKTWDLDRFGGELEGLWILRRSRIEEGVDIFPLPTWAVDALEVTTNPHFGLENMLRYPELVREFIFPV